MGFCLTLIHLGALFLQFKALKNSDLQTSAALGNETDFVTKTTVLGVFPNTPRRTFFRF